MNWYVKSADGKVFGPADDDKMLSWVKDGRVEPFAGVSNDLKNWRLASCEPLFEMDWIVESEPGRFYGPTHRNVIDDLLKSGAVQSNCRIYRDDHGGRFEKQISAARIEAENAMTEIQAEAERAMAELKAEAEKKLEAKESEIAELRNLVAAAEKRAADMESRLREEVDAAEKRAADLEKALADVNASKKREWEMEVLEPEIVSDEPPPSARESILSQPGRAQSLAELERRAQAELARMGAAGAKSFFGLKR